MSHFDLNHKNKLTLVKMMHSILVADKKEDAKEWQYFDYVCKELGLRREDIIGVEKSEIPPMEKDRMAMFYYLLFLTKIDQQLDAEEELRIHEFALKLGFNELMAQDFIELMKAHLDGPVAIEDMIAVIKKYMN